MITAPREVYKKAFKLDFEIKQQHGISYVVPLSKPVIPTALKQVVKDIVFEEPVEPF
jgi:hypothetical protein